MKNHLFLPPKITISLTLCSLLNFATASFADSSGFALSEHWAMGQQVKLRFDTSTPPDSGTALHLKNGLELSFGDIISLGDLYGIIGKPVSHGQNEKDQQKRFKRVFNTFAKSEMAINEVKELNAIIKTEIHEIEKGIEQGETVEAIYERIGNEIGRQINCATGGGCNTYGWWLYPGRYLQLAMENYDHFGSNNLITYESGHQIALKQALKAKQTGKRTDLELAYAIDAFASHYLADHFAAGHLRTPREEFNDVVTPAVLGSLLANYMHNEENKLGLHVHNDLGEQWMVYGDYSYFNPYNQTNQQMLLKALQQSADEIFETYYTGVIPDKNIILGMVPQVEPSTSENNMDIAPMFYWDKHRKELYRRADLSNPYDHHWTNSWWAWSTLIMLKSQYGLSSPIQVSLSNYVSQYTPANPG